MQIEEEFEAMSVPTIQGSTAKATPESGRLDANDNFTSVAAKAVKDMTLVDMSQSAG